MLFPRTSYDPNWARNSLKPSTDNAYDLGSSTNRFRDLYLSRDLILSATAGTIRQSTSDASDNKYVGVTGGGALGASRGATIYLYGNEHASTGALQLYGGGVSGAHLSLFLGHSGAEVRICNASSNVMWTFNNSGQIVQDATNGGVIQLNRSGDGIYAGTSDGADNIKIVIAGGGSAAATRGAYLALSGNEEANSGGVTLASGNIGDLLVYATGNGAGTRLRLETGAGKAIIAQDDNTIGFFANPSAGGGAKVIFIANASAVPSSNPTGGGIFYCDSGALKYRGSSGTVTTLGPA